MTRSVRDRYGSEEAETGHGRRIRLTSGTKRLTSGRERVTSGQKRVTRGRNRSWEKDKAHIGLKMSHARRNSSHRAENG